MGPYLDSVVESPLGISDRFSLSLWVWPETVDGSERTLIDIRSVTGGDSNGIRLSSDDAGVHLQLHNADGALAFDALYPPTLLAGDWQHIAVTYDASFDAEPSLYVNGVPQSPAAPAATGQTPSFTDTSRGVSLGGGVASLDPWWGLLGHVAIWNQALTVAEVQEISLAGHSIDLRVNAGSYEGENWLMHYWRLGDSVASLVDLGFGSPLDLEDPTGLLQSVLDGPLALTP